MKFGQIYVSALSILMIIVMLPACDGDKPLEHGTEYILSYPDGTDTSEVNNAITVLHSRLVAFGLDESDFDVITEAAKIKVRVADGVVKNPASIRSLISSYGALTFRAMYDMSEIGIAFSNAHRTYVRMMNIDSVNANSSGLLKFCVYPYSSNQSLDNFLPVVAYCLVKDTSEVNRILLIDSVQDCFPIDLIFMWGYSHEPINGNPAMSLFACKKGSNYELSGELVVNSEYQEDEYGPSVNITFNSTGTDAWARMTKANIGRSIAIEMDNLVYSCPVVQSEITDGKAQITGPGDKAEMQNVANLLSAGRMPISLRIVQEGAF